MSRIREKRLLEPAAQKPGVEYNVSGSASGTSTAQLLPFSRPVRCREPVALVRSRPSIRLRRHISLALALTALVSACGEPESLARRSTRGPGAEAGADGQAEGGRPGPASPFVDVTEEVGLDFAHINGMSGRRYFIEMVGAGAGLLDYDGDGDLDLYLVQGGPLGVAGDGRPGDRLYRNDGVAGPDGRFLVRLVDVTAEAGIVATGYGMGVATGDYDNDGHLDIYVVNWGNNQLWRNNGDGTFHDVTAESGTGDPRWSTGAAFADFDRDGWLDLIVVNYVRYSLEGDRPCYDDSGRHDYCGPENYVPELDRLFRNRGDGTFEDATYLLGLTEAFGPALGVVTADLDGDGWTDIYVANDGRENQLWINREGTRFEDRAVAAGVAMNGAGIAEASMGVVAADFDADGDEDLFMTHLNGETNTYYRNLAGGLFEDYTQRSGLGRPSLMYTGFGVVPVDYDNDGWLDLFVANGEVRVIPEQVEAGDPLPLRQRNQLLRNLGQGRFRDVTPDDEAFLPEEVSRGTAAGDIDNDGDTDMVLTSNNGPARLLLNRSADGTPWLGLRLVDRRGRDALGARVRLVTAGRSPLWRRVHTDGSYGSAHDPRVLFGLEGEAADREVVVHWPDGSVESWYGLEPGRYHTLVQGQGDRRGVT